MTIARWFTVPVSLFLFAHPAAAAPGDSCGGIAGRVCGDKEFCKFEEGAICGMGDQIGVCVTRPDFCTALHMPVCACDGKTYANACTANAAGASVMHDGACEGDAASVMPKEAGACLQVVSCGVKGGEIKKYPTPCAAKDDGAVMITQAIDDECPVSK